MTVRRVLIVGGKGFVGSALTRRLQATVGDMDVMSLSRAELDVTTGAFDSLVARADVVVNAAAGAGVSLRELFDVNVAGATKLAECCQTNSTRLVHLSSGAVLEGNRGTTDDSSPPAPRSEYATSKHLGEVGVVQAAPELACVVRLYFPYGPGQKLPRLVPRLMQALQERDPIDINEDGGPHITPGHVDDVARFLIEDFILGEPPASPVNLASDRVVAIRDLAEVLAKSLRVTPAFRVRDSPIVVPLPRPYKPGEWRSFDAEELLA